MKRFITSILRMLTLLFAGCGPAAMAQNEPIDWQSVEALDQREAAGRLSCVLRAIDYWQAGQFREIRIGYDVERAAATDGRGNFRSVTPEEWKGMVLFVHHHVQTNDRGALPWRAFPYYASGDCGDDFGEIQRFQYAVKMIDKLTLEATVIRPIHVEGVD